MTSGPMPISKKLIAVFALFFVLGPTAVYGQSTPSEFGQDKSELIHSKTLDNGLDVIVLPDPSLPIATIEIAVKNGAFTEPPEWNGLSHLYEHMFFKGNAVIPDQEAYLNRIRELGIVFNGSTSTERVNYYFTLPSENLKPGLEFMHQAITSPKFDKEQFEKEKGVVISEIDRNESSPQYWLHRAMTKKLWSKYPSRKDSLGTRESVKNATVEQMRTMQDRYYVPNNSTLLIAGDVDKQKAFELAEAIYGDWKRGPDPFEKHPVPKHPQLQGDAQVVVERPNAKVPTVRMAWQGPRVDESPGATYAADVLSFILGQSTSRFQKRLVENGPALSADLSYYTQKTKGPIAVSMQVPAEKLQKAIDLLKGELSELANPDYYTDEQLENAKTILAVRDVYGREKLSSFTHTVSFWWATAGLDYYLDYIDNLQKVTRNDIKGFVETFISGKPRVTGVLVSPKHQKKLELTSEKLKRWTQSGE